MPKPTKSTPRSEPLELIQQAIGHTFVNPSLLIEALTHPSYQQNRPEIPENNQRLEFLGDAVLQIVLSEALFKLYPTEREGLLSRRRAALSNGHLLCQIAREIGLDAGLRLSPSEESTGGRSRDSNLEDAFEAIIGATYLDGGMEDAQKVVLTCFGPLEARLSNLLGVDNPKGQLQELVQPKHGNTALVYTVTHTEGAPHQRTFEVSLTLLGKPLATGRGCSKKLAEEAAARAALAAWPKSTS